MSDTGRKNVSEQVEEKVTPDSQKSTLDQVREAVAGLYDRAAAVVQPNESKSTAQGLSDSARDTTDKASEKGKEAVDAAKDSLDKTCPSTSDTSSDPQ